LLMVDVVELDIADPLAVVVQYWRTSEVVDELPLSGRRTYDTTF